MHDHNLKYRKNKIKYRHMPPIQITNHIHINHIEEDKAEKGRELLTELLTDFDYIKSKRSLEYFVAENKEYINQLGPHQKAIFLGAISKKFFPDP